MIKISRRRAKPRKLQRDSARETRALTDAFDEDPQAYRIGAKSFSRRENIHIKNSLYRHKTVKAALIKDQHGKCAYCESTIASTQYGDVEHFRPARGYVQNDGDPLGRPGYYWLAYDWRNLFFSCQLCNQRYKRNLFPLADPTTRVRDHHGDIELERPLLIKPDIEDPALSLGFNGEIAVGRDAAGRGDQTCDALCLNRVELKERRRSRYFELKAMYVALQAGVLPKRATDLLRTALSEAQKDNSPYAGMIRAAVAAGFP